MPSSPVTPVPKYVAPPDATIIGMAIKAFVQSILYEDIAPILTEVMKSYGFEKVVIEDSRWYPLQMVLDAERKIAAQPGGSTLLVSIGTKIIENQHMPPHIDSIAACVNGMRQISGMNMHKVPPHMNFRDIEVENHRVRFVDNTVFAHDSVYGHVYGLTRRFKLPGTHPIVERTFLNSDDPAADGALYEIRW